LLQYLPYRETQINLNYMPIPNQPHGMTDLLGRWIGPGQSIWNDDHVDARGDYMVGGGNLSVAFAGGHPSRTEAADDPLEPVAFTSKVRRLKVGGTLRLKIGGFDNQQAGSVAFTSLADVQTNTPNSVTLGRSVPSTRWNLPSYSFYVQDDWRVNQKLVLNLGLREDNYYAIKVTPAAVYGGASTYEKSRAYENQPGTAAWNLDGLLDPENFTWGGLRDRNKPYENDNWNFGPRFGFAYTADSKGDFVVRGGFGVNFAGFDAGPQEEGSGQIARPDLPATKTWSRLEAAALGLKFPTYND